MPSTHPAPLQSRALPCVFGAEEQAGSRGERRFPSPRPARGEVRPPIQGRIRCYPGIDGARASGAEATHRFRLNRLTPIARMSTVPTRLTRPYRNTAGCRRREHGSGYVIFSTAVAAGREWIGQGPPAASQLTLGHGGTPILISGVTPTAPQSMSRSMTSGGSRRTARPARWSA